MGFLDVSSCVADSPPTSGGFIVTTIFVTEMHWVCGRSGCLRYSLRMTGEKVRDI
jgi:hypothetical protein